MYTHSVYIYIHTHIYIYKRERKMKKSREIYNGERKKQLWNYLCYKKFTLYAPLYMLFSLNQNFKGIIIFYANYNPSLFKIIIMLYYKSNVIVYFDIEKWIFITKYLKKEKN